MLFEESSSPRLSIATKTPPRDEICSRMDSSWSALYLGGGRAWCACRGRSHVENPVGGVRQRPPPLKVGPPAAEESISHLSIPLEAVGCLSALVERFCQSVTLVEEPLAGL